MGRSSILNGKTNFLTLQLNYAYLKTYYFALRRVSHSGSHLYPQRKEEKQKHNKLSNIKAWRLGIVAVKRLRMQPEDRLRQTSSEAMAL